MKAPQKKSTTISQLDFIRAQKTVEQAGIPFAPTSAVKKVSQLRSTSKKISFPWAMKAVGKKLIHKTDVGGVKLNVQNETEAYAAFMHMKKISGCEYVVVQPMRKGIEIIVGGKMDQQFGPTVLVGMGGIYTEVFKDSSVRVAPLSTKDMDDMIRELKIYPILAGTRGQKSINMSDLKKILLGVSKLMSTRNIKELDLNPVIATPESVQAVDVRIIEGK
jgi:acyl-CoA synthetase (NDP forming)